MVESNGSHIARDIKVLLFSIIMMQENNHNFFFTLKSLCIHFSGSISLNLEITQSQYHVHMKQDMLLCIQNISE